MGEKMHLPCQVCAVTNVQGVVTPIWVQYSNDKGELKTIYIDETRTIDFGDAGYCTIDCVGKVGTESCMVRLVLDKAVMKWSLIGKMY